MSETVSITSYNVISNFKIKSIKIENFEADQSWKFPGLPGIGWATLVSLGLEK